MPGQCLAAVRGYRFFGGGFTTGGAGDRLGPDYGTVRASAEECQAWCQSDNQCTKWVYSLQGNGCWRMTSTYTGTAVDANVVSGSCYAAANSGELVDNDCIRLTVTDRFNLKPEVIA